MSREFPLRITDDLVIALISSKGLEGIISYSMSYDNGTISIESIDRGTAS